MGPGAPSSEFPREAEESRLVYESPDFNNTSKTLDVFCRQTETSL